MLPERELVAIRIKANGQPVQQPMTVRTTESTEASLALGLMLWVNLFAVSIIAALF